MKKSILCFATGVILSALCYGQAITLGAGNIASFGATFDQRRDTAHIVYPGNAGANVTWDMSALTSGTGLNKNIVAVDPATLPSGARFVAAGANIAMSETGSITSYFFRKTSEAIVVIGYTMDLAGNGDTVCIIFSEPDTMLTFPSSYNTNFITNVFGDTKSPIDAVIDTVIMGNPVSVPVDSVRIKHSAVKSSVFDGWGTLTMPNGQVDALRQQTYERSQDSAWVHINFPGFYTGWVFYTTFEDTINQYVWWSEFSGMPLLKMNYDSLSLQISMVDWLYDAELFIGREDANPEIGIFPNPANDMLTIRTEITFDMLQVFDRNGREVYRKGIEGKNDIIVNTAGLSEGFYLARLSGNNMPPVIKKIIIQR